MSAAAAATAAAAVVAAVTAATQSNGLRQCAAQSNFNDCKSEKK